MEAKVVPTYVGVILQEGQVPQGKSSSPHIRGGDSMSSSIPHLVLK